MKNRKVIISGAGLAGSLLASCLAKKGAEVIVFERRPDMRKGPIEGGRSINLSLSTRGLRALERVGMADAILEQAIPMHGRLMHDTEGKLTYQAYGKEGQYINSVSRAGLNLKLIELADKFENVSMHFNTRVVDANFETNSIEIEMPDGTTEKHSADFIISADGAFSPIRLAMQKTPRFSYSQSYENYGYKELEIRPNEDGSFKLEKNALHIWPRGDFMMIALPNPDGTFTCTLFLAYEGKISFDTIKTKEDVKQFFQTYFSDVLPLIHELETTFFKNPIGSLVTVRCNPWVRGKIALLGDAAHAVVPFYGQGMNCAFEDVAVLDELIDKMGTDDVTALLDAYQNERITNANAIADLALQNFIEMRDLVGKDSFLAFKMVEANLCKNHGDVFKSQYELVTFSEHSYKTAQDAGEANANLIKEIIDNDWFDKIGDQEWFSHLVAKHQLPYLNPSH
jgi:kynurenine 3-monooxygenase